MDCIIFRTCRGASAVQTMQLLHGGFHPALFVKIDDYATEIISKTDGKVTTTNRTVYSRDGKTRTRTFQGTNAQGIKINNTVVSEK